MIAGGVTEINISAAKNSHCNSGNADAKSKCESAVNDYATQHPQDESMVVPATIGYSCYTDQWQGVKERPAECVTLALGALDKIKQGIKLKAFTKTGTAVKMPDRPVDFNRGGVSGIAADTPAAAVLAQIKAKAEETGWKNEPAQLKASASFSTATLDEIGSETEIGVNYEALRFGTPLEEKGKPPHSFDLHFLYNDPTIQSFLLDSDSAYVKGEHPTIATRELYVYPSVTFGKEMKRESGDEEDKKKVDVLSLTSGFGIIDITANDPAIGLFATGEYARDGLGNVGFIGYLAPCATANMYDPDPTLKPSSDRFCLDGLAYGGKFFAGLGLKPKDNKAVKSFGLKGDISYITAGQDAAPGTDKANFRWNVGADVTFKVLQGLKVYGAFGHRTRTLNDAVETEDYRYVPKGGVDLSITERLTLKTALAYWMGAYGADYSVLGGGYGTGNCTTYEGDPCDLTYKAGGDTLLAGGKASYTLFTYETKGGLAVSFGLNGGLDYLSQSSVYDPSQNRSLWVAMFGGGLGVEPTKD